MKPGNENVKREIISSNVYTKQSELATTNCILPERV